MQGYSTLINILQVKLFPFWTNVQYYLADGRVMVTIEMVAIIFRGHTFAFEDV